MTRSEYSRLGAIAVNKLMTPKKRRKAAKIGWETRRKNTIKSLSKNRK